MKNYKVQKKGIHNEMTKNNYDLFIQFTSNENITIPDQKPDIEEISSVIVDPEIISLRVVKTPKGCSDEGQRLTGKKIIAEIKLRQKILYVSNTETQSLHAVENEFYQSTYIVIPEKIKGTDPKLLLECNYLQPHITIENIFAKKTDNRSIAKIIHLLIKIHIVPTYELCYTEDYNCTCSNLFIVHSDGTKKNQLTDFEDRKIYSPQWSPCGQKIAFITKDKRNQIMLNLLQVRNESIIKLTNPFNFSFIGSYCWGNNSNIIYFSAFYKETKEIFEMNVSRITYKQLTYSDCETQNFKPKSSPDGKKIAYLKNIKVNTNLYIMNTDGLGTKKLTSTGGIRDFDWSEDSSIIAYIDTKESRFDYNDVSSTYVISGEKKGDYICLVNLINGSKSILPVYNLNLSIRKLLYSPDNRYLAFIGRGFKKDNIYIYDLLKNDIIKLASHDVLTNISDFVWNLDSNAIYYASNDLTFFNVYSVQIESKERNQISNTTADKILLDYRKTILNMPYTLC